MLDLDANLSLASALIYPSPKRPTDYLPLVYGDLGQGASGVWTAICVDSLNLVYALAGHPLAGPVHLYDKNGPIDPADYSLNLAHNYLYKGVVATATFAAPPNEPVTVRGRGKPDAGGGLIDNPLDLARDLLLTAAGATLADLDANSFRRAQARAAGLGYRAAGVVERPRQVGQVLAELLGCFLGNSWRDGRGRLRFSLDIGAGAVTDGDLLTSFSAADLRDMSATANLDDLCNLAAAHYAYSWADKAYAAAYDGQDARDQRSIGLYGLLPRLLELPWVRDPATARTVCGRLVGLVGFPRRLISFEEAGLVNLPLEVGDPALLSLPWLGDEMGRPLVNQIVRVLALEPRFDAGSTRVTVLDTGYFKTRAHPADGSWLADGGCVAGGERDRREYC